MKLPRALARKERIRGRGRNPISVKHLIAQLAGPGLIERHHSGEKKGYPNQSAGDLARFFSVGIEREAENHDHQQGKKQHGVDRVFRSPLQAQVFGQRRQGNACADAAGLALRFGRNVLSDHLVSSGRSSLVRRTICPASIQTNSSVASSSNDAWWVTTKIVLPAVAHPGQQRDHGARRTNIHVGKWLVQQQNLGIVEQSSRQR